MRDAAWDSLQVRIVTCRRFANACAVPDVERTATVRPHSLVRGTSVTHGANLHNADDIVDTIDDAIVADAQSPEIDGTSQLLAPRGTRLGDEGLDASKHPFYHHPVEPLKLLPSRAGEPDLELTHYA